MQTLVEGNIAYNEDAGVTTLSFTKLLVEEDGQIPILESRINYFLWARGRGGQLSYHVNGGHFELDFAATLGPTGSQTTVESEPLTTSAEPTTSVPKSVTPTTSVPSSPAPSPFSPSEPALKTALRRFEPLYERNCDKNHTLASQSMDEFEISFVYGVESARADYAYIGDLEDWILYTVAKSTLHCLDEGRSHFLRSATTGENDVSLSAGVEKISYPRDGEISSRTPCDPVSPAAKGCAVWHTRLVISSVGLSLPEVRRGALQTLSNSFDNNTFVGHVPDLISTAYLGPHIDDQVMHYELRVDGEGYVSARASPSLLFISTLLGACCVAAGLVILVLNKLY